MCPNLPHSKIMWTCKSLLHVSKMWTPHHLIETTWILICIPHPGGKYLKIIVPRHHKTKLGWIELGLPFTKGLLFFIFFFYVNWKLKMAISTGHSSNIVPYGKKKIFSQKLIILLCINDRIVFYNLYVCVWSEIQDAGLSIRGGYKYYYPFIMILGTSWS